MVQRDMITTPYQGEPSSSTISKFGFRFSMSWVHRIAASRPVCKTTTLRIHDTVPRRCRNSSESNISRVISEASLFSPARLSAVNPSMHSTDSRIECSKRLWTLPTVGWRRIFDNKPIGHIVACSNR